MTRLAILLLGTMLVGCASGLTGNLGTLKASGAMFRRGASMGLLSINSETDVGCQLARRRGLSGVMAPPVGCGYLCSTERTKTKR